MARVTSSSRWVSPYASTISGATSAALAGSMMRASWSLPSSIEPCTSSHTPDRVRTRAGALATGSCAPAAARAWAA